jgi:hypothetical protein
MPDNYTDLREAVEKTFVARNITTVVLKGDLRDNQPCNYEIPFELFADFITQLETDARIDELETLPEHHIYPDSYGARNDRIAELKTLTKPEQPEESWE